MSTILPTLGDGSSGPQYDPERHLYDLAERGGWRVVFEPLQGIVGLTDWRTRTVTIDSRGLQREQRSTMAHEAVHVERGPFPKWALKREERQVHRIAARRLIDLDELVDAVKWTDSPEELAEALGVRREDVVMRIQNLTPEEAARFDRALPGHRRRRRLR